MIYLAFDILSFFILHSIHVLESTWPAYSKKCLLDFGFCFSFCFSFASHLQIRFWWTLVLCSNFSSTFAGCELLVRVFLIYMLQAARWADIQPTLLHLFRSWWHLRSESLSSLYNLFTCLAQLWLSHLEVTLPIPGSHKFSPSVLRPL